MPYGAPQATQCPNTDLQASQWRPNFPQRAGDRLREPMLCPASLSAEKEGDRVGVRVGERVAPLAPGPRIPDTLKTLSLSWWLNQSARSGFWVTHKLNCSKESFPSLFRSHDSKAKSTMWFTST